MLVFTGVYVCVKAKLTLVSYFFLVFFLHLSLSIRRNMKSANTIAMILSYCCDTVASGLVEKGKVAQCKLEGCAIAETKHKTQYEVGEDHCNRALSEKSCNSTDGSLAIRSPGEESFANFR